MYVRLRVLCLLMLLYSFFSIPETAGDALCDKSSLPSQPYTVPIADEKTVKRWAIVCLYSANKPGKVLKRNDHLAAALKPYARDHVFTVLVFSEDLIPKASIDEWTAQFRDIASLKAIDTSSNVCFLSIKWEAILSA
jgi:hypothetical protein